MTISFKLAELYKAMTEARDEYDRVKQAYERANSDLFRARTEWERLYFKYTDLLRDNAESKPSFTP